MKWPLAKKQDCSENLTTILHLEIGTHFISVPIFSAPSNTAEDKYDMLYEDYYSPQNLSLTRRVANAIFNPTLFAIVAIPLIIGNERPFFKTLMWKSKVQKVCK